MSEGCQGDRAPCGRYPESRTVKASLGRGLIVKGYKGFRLEEGAVEGAEVVAVGLEEGLEGLGGEVAGGEFLPDVVYGY